MQVDDKFQSDPARMNLLKLVSRGHAVIAELNRLSDHIPPVFRMETKEDQQKVCNILSCIITLYFSISSVTVPLVTCVHINSTGKLF